MSVDGMFWSLYRCHKKQRLVNILQHACSSGPSLRAGPHHRDCEVNGQAACGFGGTFHELNCAYW